MNAISGRAFDRVLIIMFENMYRGYVMQNSFMRGLAEKGIDMTNYHGVMHPSQTNYISSIAGELCNVSGDDRPPELLSQRTIVDLVENKGLDWKAYMQGYCPGAAPWSPQLTPEDNYPYVIKHNPFSSFKNIVQDKQRWEKIVSSDQLFTDAANNQLPEYAWFTPDMWNDGHYTIGTHSSPHQRAPALVDQQAIWLQYFFSMLKFPGPGSVIPDSTLVVVTYDEADFEADYLPRDQYKYYYDGPNQVYTVLLGSMIKPGFENEGYNHYSLLKTVEKNFDLANLGKNDKSANWFQFLWGRRFAWKDPSETPFKTNGPIAMVSFEGVPTLAFRDESQALLVARQENGQWSNALAVGDSGSSAFAFAVANDILYLIIGTSNGIFQRTFTTAHGWSATASKIISSGAVRSLSVAAFDDDQQLMLAWSNEVGEIHSLLQSGGVWATNAVGVGPETGQRFTTKGEIRLAVLGANIFCIYEAEHSDTLMVVSYNSEPFNVIIAEQNQYSGPYNNTTVNQWSPSAFPVEAFTHSPNPKTPGEPEPVTEVFSGCSPLACGTLDGVVHLVHAKPGSSEIVSETFSISGLLTPKLPVSYKSSEATTTNDGYGTLAQAGWSEQSPIHGTQLGSTPSMAMASDGEKLWLASTEASGEIVLRIGGYTQGA